MTLWNPENTARCVITGFTVGITTDPLHVANRCYNTWWQGNTATKILVGGGVTLKLFNLNFLWKEHKLYHNYWSRTNDGFDLARYYGTKFYLPPHRDMDYIFWYDREAGTYTPQDYMRGHPAQLLNCKTAVYVRSQTYGRQTKTKKVMIRPPSNITNVWKYQPDWFNYPLFLWGISLVDWRYWFSTTQDNPLPMVSITAYVYQGTQYNSQHTIDYCHYIDTGVKNTVMVAYVGSNLGGNQVGNTTWYPVDWANDLPYWLVFYGANRNMDMNAVPNTNLQQYPNHTTWLKLYWPLYTSSVITSGKPLQTYNTFVISAADAQKIGRSGPFVQGNIVQPVQIPILYKSFWKWGGSIFSNEQPIKMTSGAQAALVSVKNPLTQQRSLIYPWDTRDGILTGSALQRICEPRSGLDERPPFPGPGQPTGHATTETYGGASTETEESETDTDGEEDERPALHHLKECLKREQLKRRRIKSLLLGLIKRPKFETDPLME